MRRMIFGTFFVVLSLVFWGCGTVNNALVEKHKNVEYYRIFDIKTTANRAAVIKAASNGLGKNVHSAVEATPIPNFSIPPVNPGRFKLVNPFANSNSSLAGIAALSAGGGSLGIKIAQCDGAVWTAKANRRIKRRSNLNLTACLWQYKDGYHLDLYANFQKEEGGVLEISRQMANAMVGTPEQWTEKTFLDIVRSIQSKTNAQITFLEGYPELSGTPWLDKIAE